MPIYEYKCEDEKCGTITEKMRRFSQSDDPCPCEKCGKKTKRKISAGSFSLKGGGWAKDGYSG